MTIKSVEDMVKVANSEVVTLTADEALRRSKAENITFVDIRDIRELEKVGKLEDAEHAPRGMLEFWFDPSCKYHRPCFGDESSTYVLFCAMGWRSALSAKTLQDMGFGNIAHVEGGFTALKEAGAKLNMDEG